MLRSVERQPLQVKRRMILQAGYYFDYLRMVDSPKFRLAGSVEISASIFKSEKNRTLKIRWSDTGFLVLHTDTVDNVCIAKTHDTHGQD